MSLLRRVGVNALRNLKPKAGHNSESFWSEGKQEKVDSLPCLILITPILA